MSGEVLEAADGVFLVHGTEVNWVLLRDGADLTLIDSGYPGDIATLEGSIRSIGSRPEDVRAILLTHAHIDHMGGATLFAQRYGTPVYLDPAEVPHAKRDYLEQAGPFDVAKNSWRPGVLAWSLRIARVGAMKHVSLSRAQPFPAAGALDLPGRPTPVPTPGHTSGHSAFYLADAGAVVTGDALITAHAVSRTRGPQVSAPMFQSAGADLVGALDTLAGLPGELLLPGHGPLHRGSIIAAVAAARESRR